MPKSTPIPSMTVFSVLMLVFVFVFSGCGSKPSSSNAVAGPNLGLFGKVGPDSSFSCQGRSKEKDKKFALCIDFPKTPTNLKSKDFHKANCEKANKDDWESSFVDYACPKTDDLVGTCIPPKGDIKALYYLMTVDEAGKHCHPNPDGGNSFEVPTKEEDKGKDGKDPAKGDAAKHDDGHAH